MIGESFFPRQLDAIRNELQKPLITSRKSITGIYPQPSSEPSAILRVLVGNFLSHHGNIQFSATEPVRFDFGKIKVDEAYGLFESSQSDNSLGLHIVRTEIHRGWKDLFSEQKPPADYLFLTESRFRDQKAIIENRPHWAHPTRWIEEMADIKHGIRLADVLKGDSTRLSDERIEAEAARIGLL